jgi:hypothetical protein
MKSESNKSPVPKVVWRGDLSDDCHAKLGDLGAHCECMGGIDWRESEQKRGRHERSEIWYCSVYLLNRKGHALHGDLFHTGNPGGMIIGGSMARAVCEAILLANYSGPHKQAWMAGATAGTELTFDLVLRSLEKLRLDLGVKSKTASKNRRGRNR